MKKIINTIFICCFILNSVYAMDDLEYDFNEYTEENKKNDHDLKIKDVKENNKADIVVIQALNKITAKTYKYNVKVGSNMIFERLIIKPMFCWKSSPEEIPENKVLLKIIENKLDKTRDTIFYGWMFSSSHGVSSVEHPMYDITIIDCIKTPKEILQ